MTRQMLSAVSSGRLPWWRCDEAAHHVGLARRAESGAGFLALFDRDQAIDDFAALDQKPMHLLVDTVDLAPQIGERLVLMARRFRHGSRWLNPAIGPLDRCR